MAKQEIGYYLQEPLRLIWVKLMIKNVLEVKSDPNIKTGKETKRSMKENKTLLALLAIVTELQKVLTSGSTFMR